MSRTLLKALSPLQSASCLLLKNWGFQGEVHPVRLRYNTPTHVLACAHDKLSLKSNDSMKA